MTGRAPLTRPGGMPPPAVAELADGTTVDLLALAELVTERHLARHAEDTARYGDDLARAWCTHDNQHVLQWAVQDADLDGQLAWLAGLLDARGYPVANLIDNVATAAEVCEAEIGTPAGRAVAARLRGAGRALADRRA